MDANVLEPTSVRLPPGVLTELRRRASANRRSLNSEVIVTLERALQQDAKASEAA